MTVLLHPLAARLCTCPRPLLIDDECLKCGHYLHADPLPLTLQLRNTPW